MWLSMQRWQSPSYKVTLETLFWSKMWKNHPFSDTKSIYLCEFYYIASYKQEMHRKKTIMLIYNLNLIRQNFPGYRCVSGIVVFASWNYTAPFIYRLVPDSEKDTKAVFSTQNDAVNICNKDKYIVHF